MKSADVGENSPLLNEVKSVIASVLNIDAGDITADSHFFFDLGGTSIQYFSLLGALSEKFEITDVSKNEDYCYTPRDICKFLERFL